MKRLGTAAMVLLALGLGLWIGWHKDAISAHLSRWRGQPTEANRSSSPSPGPLMLPEYPAEATVQSPTPAPSLVDQLVKEGIELRDYRGDTTNAVERLKEALDSEPDNAVILSELAKTYDVMQLHERANEIWRRLQEMGPAAGAAYELADRRLKVGAPTPAEAQVSEAPDPSTPMIPSASNSSLPEVNASPYETAADLQPLTVKPREQEIDHVSPAPTATASEVTVTARASPGASAVSTETNVAEPGGRLIVLRGANFGWNLALNLKIDGKTAANIVQGGRYDEFVPAGRHTLTVSAVPNYRPTATVLNVQHGQTYVFTATRQNADSVVLVPSALAPGQQ